MTLTGYAVFAQLEDKKDKPVVPVDFDLCDRGNVAYEEPVDENILTDALRRAKAGLKGWADVWTMNDPLTGHRVSFTVFENAADARDMMEAQELGHGAAGQAAFLCQFEAENKIQTDSVRAELEFSGFGVYKVKTIHGNWKLASNEPVTNFEDVFESRKPSKYSRRQIQEAIAYWESQLDLANEDENAKAEKELPAKINKLKDLIGKAVKSDKIQKNEKVLDDIKSVQDIIKNSNLNEADTKTIANVILVSDLVDTLCDMLTNLIS